MASKPKPNPKPAEIQKPPTRPDREVDISRDTKSGSPQLPKK